MSRRVAKRNPLSSGWWRGVLVALLWGCSLGIPAGPVLAAMLKDAGCSQYSLPRTDDGWASDVQLGFPLKLGDGFYDSTFVSNNGYVSFGSAPLWWWMIYLPQTFYPMITPLQLDVDTRPPMSDVVTYGQTTYGGRRAFCVNWGGHNGVGLYDWREELLNRFQLLLVERADAGLGDFDIIFNYDQVQYDYSDISVVYGNHRVTWIGWYPGNAYAIEGSGVLPSLLKDGESRSLTERSSGSPMPGRYIFQVRGGLPSVVSVVSGTVQGPFGAPLKGAPVYICSTVDPTRCYFATTNAQGMYTLMLPNAEMDGQPYTLATQTPAAQGWTAPAPIQVTPRPSEVLIAPLLALQVPRPLGVDMAVEPSRLTANGAPSVYWQEGLTLSIDDCNDASVTIDITTGMDGTGPSILGGPQAMAENPIGSGHYEYTVDEGLWPNHGWVTVVYSILCPGGVQHDTSFNLYIDPSGNVLNANENPIRGALVTLYRSDSPLGPFDLVPNGSAIMSPTNRQNPMYSDETGHFGWDTVPGFYIVRAAKPGCTSVGSPGRPYVETEVLPVPPPVMDLRLVLDCSAVPPPVISAPARLDVEASSRAGALVSYTVSASDASDGPLPVQCTPESGSLFPMGTTQVACSTMSSYGHRTTVSFPVVVADTTPPVLTVPAPLSAFATTASGARVSYVASAVDLMDGAIRPECTPASGSLFAPGTTEVQCRATDTSGNSAYASFPVRVTFEYGGVLSPLMEGGQVAFHRNQVIPVRFELTGASITVTLLRARLFIAPVVAGGVGPEQPALGVGRGDNVFEARGPLALYQLLLPTRGLAPGTYRLRIDLGDGVLHTATFSVPG